MDKKRGDSEIHMETIIFRNFQDQNLVKPLGMVGIFVPALASPFLVLEVFEIDAVDSPWKDAFK